MNNTLINNRYHIVQNLGRGGFGETFLAVDTHLPSGQKCVLKRLKPLIAESKSLPWIQEKFQQEASILEQLGAKNSQIPKLYAYFVEHGEFYLVQEWIEGVTLSEKVAQVGKLTEAEVRDILVNLLPVLDYLHSLRIVHRDIKPDNIILRANDNKPVLIDFGAVKEAVTNVMQPQGYATVSMAVGTPGYMASEQAAGRPLYSSDLYSLGLTAIFLLTGKHPPVLDNDPQTGEILWRRELPTLHSALAMVIDRSIRFNPRDRFASAKEMLASLQISSNNSKVQNKTIAPNPSRQKTLAYNPNLPNSNPNNLSSNNFVKFLIGFVITLGIALGAFAVGFWLVFQPKNSSDSDPIVFPSETSSPNVETPSPTPTTETTPTPIRTPTIRRTRRPTPQATITPSPTPTPEATITPTPTIPEVTPTPEATITPTPTTPEVTPTPEPTITLTPVAPETVPTIELTPTAKPKSTPTTTPTPKTAPSQIEVIPVPKPETTTNP
jgi:serine/threonine protein kinase, bacterial